MKESIDKEWNSATLERTKIFPEEDAIELIQERFFRIVLICKVNFESEIYGSQAKQWYSSLAGVPLE